MKQRPWVIAAWAGWSSFGVYVGTMLWLVGRYQPKIATEGLDRVERDALYVTLGGRLYQELGLAWSYNRYIVPLVLVVAIGASIIAWSAGRHREAAT